MSPAKPTPPTTTEPARELTFATRVGRALGKLLEINESELHELQASPETIKAKHAKRRAELLAGLEPAVKAAVLGAATAGETKAAE